MGTGWMNENEVAAQRIFLHFSATECAACKAQYDHRSLTFHSLPEGRKSLNIAVNLFSVTSASSSS